MKSNLRRRRVAAVIVITVLLFMTTLLLTPPGQAWARSVFQYFTFAESDSLPLPTEQLTQSIPPTRTAAPTQILELQKIETTPEYTSSPTPTQQPEQVSAETIWGLSIDEAEALAGYPLIVPASLPPGYRLEEIIYNLESQHVIQLYKFHPYQSGELFTLTQSLTPIIGEVGNSASVEVIQLGNTYLEYVTGGWFSPVGSASQQWIPGQPVHTFSWQSDQFYFTLQFWVNETFSPAYLMKEDMLAMVEVVTGSRTEFPERINFNYLTNLEIAEEISGFDILEPALLPEGLGFSYASYVPEGPMMVLIYGPVADSRSNSSIQLTIFESPIRPDTQEPAWDEFPPGAVEEVTIGSLPGIFIRGAIVNGVYDPDFGLVVSWQAAGLEIRIRYTSASWNPEKLDKEQLLAIAESLQ